MTLEMKNPMVPLENKNVLVIGLGASGLAATSLLCKCGAKVVAVDSAQTDALRQATADLAGRGVTVHLGASAAPPQKFDLAVVSPGVPWTNPILKSMVERSVPVIGEFELGYQHTLCLNLSITGTNGKTTTTELVERLLTSNRLKTLAAGNIGRPICEVVD